MKARDIEEYRAYRRAEFERRYARNPEKMILYFKVNSANQRAKGRGIPGRLDWREVAAVAFLQDYKCFDCHDEKPLTIGHGIPFDRDGRNDIENVVLQCFSCNMKQHNHIHPAFVAA